MLRSYTGANHPVSGFPLSSVFALASYARLKVVHPLGFEPKSPASEARILSIEIRVPAPNEAAGAHGSQPFPAPPYLAGITRSAKSA